MSSGIDSLEVFINVLKIVIKVDTKEFKSDVPFQFKVRADFDFRIEVFTNWDDLRFVKICRQS